MMDYISLPLIKVSKVRHRNIASLVHKRGGWADVFYLVPLIVEYLLHIALSHSDTYQSPTFSFVNKIDYFKGNI